MVPHNQGIPDVHLEVDRFAPQVADVLFGVNRCFSHLAHTLPPASLGGNTAMRRINVDLLAIWTKEAQHLGARHIQTDPVQGSLLPEHALHVFDRNRHRQRRYDDSQGTKATPIEWLFQCVRDSLHHAAHAATHTSRRSDRCLLFWISDDTLAINTMPEMETAFSRQHADLVGSMTPASNKFSNTRYVHCNQNRLHLRERYCDNSLHRRWPQPAKRLSTARRTICTPVVSSG